MKIAYLVTEYPKVSHSFIRREILALETLGFSIERISIRGWDCDLIEPQDIDERLKTFYILKAGVISLFPKVLQSCLNNPAKFFSVLVFALKLSKISDKSFLYHLAYFAESCLLAIRLKKLEINHLHIHFGTNSTDVGMLACLMVGIPYSFTVHGPDEFDRARYINLSEKIKHASFVVAISSFCRSQIYRWVPHSEWAKIKIVHCGIDSEFYEDHVQSIPNELRVVCVGRLSEQKGQLLLIDAISQIVKEGINIKLVLAGDGEMRTQIQDLVRSCKIENHVQITGWLSASKVRDEIIKSKFLVLPSFAEGLPVVIMEAMSLSRPVLSTYIAAIPELIIHNESGFLIPPGDTEALIKAIKNILTLPESKLDVIAKSARQTVLERHSITKEAIKLSTYLRNAKSFF